MGDATFVGKRQASRDQLYEVAIVSILIREILQLKGRCYQLRTRRLLRAYAPFLIFRLEHSEPLAF
jgi:hypothetical protein